MKNIYTQRAELGSATEQVKKHQDTLLDMYDPKNARLNALLAELVGLERELEDLDKEFEVLQQRGWPSNLIPILYRSNEEKHNQVQRPAGN